jgi:sugar lactone lactonase YvrE
MTALLFALACSETSEPPSEGEPLTVLATFDPAQGQLPEGVAVDEDHAYVGLATLGEIWSLPLDGSAEPEPYASVPPLPPDAAFLTGLTLDGEGRLYAAVASFSPELEAGIWRAPAGGGQAEPHGTGELVFANDSAFASDGTLYVTDSFGAVYRVAPDGQTTAWATDPLLLGDRAACGRQEALFDIGANGLVVTGDAIYVANSDHGSIVQIPLEADGSAGPAALFAGPDCEALAGIDGFARDPSDGSFYAALSHQDRVVHVDADGSVSTLIDDPVLDFPASIRLLEQDGRRSLIVTNFALDEALSGGEPRPSLIRWWLD